MGYMNYGAFFVLAETAVNHVMLIDLLKHFQGHDYDNFCIG